MPNSISAEMTTSRRRLWYSAASRPPATPSGGGDGDAGGGQLDRPGQAGQDLVQHGLAAAHRRAQVEVHQAAEERGVLDRARLVEAKLVADVLDVGLAGEQSGDDAGRVAGQQPHHHEDDDRHAQQRRHGGDQAASDVVQHNRR